MSICHAHALDGSVLDFVKKKKKSETENPRDEYDDSRSRIVASKLNAKMNAH